MKKTDIVDGIAGMIAGLGILGVVIYGLTVLAIDLYSAVGAFYTIITCAFVLSIVWLVVRGLHSKLEDY